MNSRGTLISHRSSGDTLATRDTVAMTPTVQPAAAGTHRKRDFDRLPERGVASVTDREDMPSNLESPDDAPCVAECCSSCLPAAATSNPASAGRDPRRRSAERQLMAAKLIFATIPAKARNSKWRPTPTASHEKTQLFRESLDRRNGPVTGVMHACSAANAGGLIVVRPRSVGLGPCGAGPFC